MCQEFWRGGSLVFWILLIYSTNYASKYILLFHYKDNEKYISLKSLRQHKTVSCRLSNRYRWGGRGALHWCRVPNHRWTPWNNWKANMYESTRNRCSLHQRQLPREISERHQLYLHNESARRKAGAAHFLYIWCKFTIGN